MPERVDFWGIPQPWGPLLVYAVLGLATLVMLARFVRELGLAWRVGRRGSLSRGRSTRLDRVERARVRAVLRGDLQLFRRLRRTLEYTFAQSKLLTQRYPGWMHLLLVWSFCVFFLGTALATINGHLFKFLSGGIYLVYKLALDSFALVFLAGMGMAGYRRWVQRPARLTYRPRFTLSLLFLLFIVLNGLLVTSLRLAILRPEWAAWAPVSWTIAQVWIASAAPAQTLQAWFMGVYSLHFLTVALFFVTLPAGTLAHMVLAPLNVFLAELDQPVRRLAPVLAGEGGNRLYAGELGGLARQQLLNGAACTECGRCQAVCPAYAAGQPLDPRQVVLDVRAALDQTSGMPLEKAVQLPLAVGGRFSAEALWACTSCLACVQECPVLIDPLSIIVDLRRHLVQQGRLDSSLQLALENLALYGNTSGEAGGKRAAWAQGLAQSIPDARARAVEYLWFVGDTAAYTPGASEAARITAEVFQAAGVDFGLLYEAERSAGNDARRIGEEGLFEQLAAHNARVLAQCDFQAIVTTDPHTYHALKNEYPREALKGRPVLHYTELLGRLAAEGRLKLSHSLDLTVTYHDPCYLGRYNGVYDAPRRVLAALGCQLMEMPRCRANALCCGAGGGRMWMKESHMLERPSLNRIREAEALAGVTHFVVACPKDLVMYRDAVDARGAECKLQVVDLAELVKQAL